MQKMNGNNKLQHHTLLALARFIIRLLQVSALNQQSLRLYINKVNNQPNSNFIIQMPSSHPNYVYKQCCMKSKRHTGGHAVV